MPQDTMTVSHQIRPELLAPGGSWESMQGAVAAGADAVYMGGQMFGARAYAKNPDPQQLLEAIDFCHLHGRKLYLTVNTLLKEEELKGQLYDYMAPLYERGLDAVLVQDLGVWDFLHKNFPSLPLHASTQMSVQSAQGAAFLKSIGAKRIVPARELSLQEVSAIREASGLEVECFIHGALCYSYSGQCLLSSVIGGRSGNRGRCAQPCRQRYLLCDENGDPVHRSEAYLMSLKDICTLKFLPLLVNAGISSFKIEGRMKRPEYTAGVVEIYRKYLDRCMDAGQQDYKTDPQDMKDLMDLYNRGGFSSGFYFIHNDKNMLSPGRPNHAGTPAARAEGKHTFTALDSLKAGDVIETDPQPGHQGFEVTLKQDVAAGKQFRVTGGPVLKKGTVVPRVRSEVQLARIRSLWLDSQIKEKIKGKFTLRAGRPAILEVSFQDVHVSVAGAAAEPAVSRALTEDTVIRQLSKTGNTPFTFEQIECDIEGGLFVPIPQLNEMRREAAAQLEHALLERFLRTDALHAEDSDAAAETCSKPGLSAAKLHCAVQTPPQLAEVLKCSSVTRVYLDSAWWLDAYAAQAKGNVFDCVSCAIPHDFASGSAVSGSGISDGKQSRKNPDPAVLKTVRKDPDSGALTALREDILRTLSKVKSAGMECFLRLPVIWRGPVRERFFCIFDSRILDGFDGYLLRCLDQIGDPVFAGSGKTIVSDVNLYAMNREAVRTLHRFGIHEVTLPAELNAKELMTLSPESFACEMIVYGRYTVMCSASCLMKNTHGCTQRGRWMYLSDKTGAAFPVYNHCGICTNMIYNSLPLSLAGEERSLAHISAGARRLEFTTENPEETCAVLAAWAGREAPAGNGKTTRGHFRRGVL